MDSEGIYRVSGFAEEIEELKGCCDNKGEYLLCWLVMTVTMKQ